MCTSQDSTEHSSQLSAWNPSWNSARYSAKRWLSICRLLFYLCNFLGDKSRRKKLVLMEEALGLRMDDMHGRRRGRRRRRGHDQEGFFELREIDGVRVVQGNQDDQCDDDGVPENGDQDVHDISRLLQVKMIYEHFLKMYGDGAIGLVWIR